jgi:hypothetical protein
VSAPLSQQLSAQLYGVQQAQATGLSGIRAWLPDSNCPPGTAIFFNVNRFTYDLETLLWPLINALCDEFEGQYMFYHDRGSVFQPGTSRVWVVRTLPREQIGQVPRPPEHSWYYDPQEFGVPHSLEYIFERFEKEIRRLVTEYPTVETLAL